MVIFLELGFLCSTNTVRLLGCKTHLFFACLPIRSIFFVGGMGAILLSQTKPQTRLYVNGTIRASVMGTKTDSFSFKPKFQINFSIKALNRIFSIVLKIL